MALATDYLVVGAGAVGMAFADALVGASDADVLLVDRRDGPGGHWRVAYPFVRLHQPSALYGLAARPLGHDTRDADGLNAGLYERATGAEIVDYFDDALRDLVAGGRVRFVGGCEYVGDWSARHAIRRADGTLEEVGVRRRIVDARYLEGSVPAETPPRFAVDGPGVVTPNDLPDADRSAGVTVLGSGKTAIDAVQWLLESGDDPDSITWVRPRDPWLVNRRFVQPLDLVGWSVEGQARDTEAVADATSVDDLFARLEDAEQVVRLDRRVAPTMFREATSVEAEVAQVATVERVVRAGRVRRVDDGAIHLDGAALSRVPGDVIVHCTAAGIPYPPALTVYDGPRLTVQRVGIGSPTFSAALIGFVETLDADDDERNYLCSPDPYPSVPVDWLASFARRGRAMSRWGRDARVSAWLTTCRTSVTGAVLARLDEPMVADALGRIGARARDARDNGAAILVAAGAGPAT